VKYIIDKKDEKLNYHEILSNLPLITSTEAIDDLLNLLHFCKGQLQTIRVYFGVEAKVMEALFKIGSQSAENFQIVKSALIKFIDDYSGILGDLNYLEMSILRIEEQLILNQSAGSTLGLALQEYAAIKERELVQL